MSSTIFAQRCPLCQADRRQFIVYESGHNITDLTGQTFNRLTAQHFVGIGPSRKSYWCCLCSCGGAVVVMMSALRNGNSPSCGCIRRENQLKLHQTHGMTHTQEFNIWTGMIQRCHNPKHTNYKYYGGRGIFVCDAWRDSFEAFYADMGPAPSGTSIERKSNADGYSKENCYWASKTEQANNMRSNRLVTWRDETLTLAQWARRTGQKYAALLARLDRGMDIESALTLPRQRTGPRKRSS
jgi:hypothetical protein